MKRLLTGILMLLFVMVAQAQQVVHTVQRGETFELIARRYNIGLNELMAANPGEEECFVGMSLNIPNGSNKSNHINIITPIEASQLERAADLIKEGQYKKATSLYSEVIKTSPTASAYFGRGISFYNREKYKSAINDFESAINSSDCTSEMKEHCNRLIADAEKLRAEQHERRNNLLGGLTAVVVGAAAVTATAAMSSNNSNMYMPPSKANGFQRDTSMDYLLDPRYTIMEMERQDMAEYMQFKQNTGMDISFEQFRMLKYTPADSNSDANNSAIDSNSYSSGNSSSSGSYSPKQSSNRQCPQCHGTGRMEYNTNPTQYGGLNSNNYKVRCNECGKEFLKSWGHTHITCKICHGRGTI